MLYFVLVDKEKRIRGYYDGTNLEEMDKLLQQIVDAEEKIKALQPFKL